MASLAHLYQARDPKRPSDCLPHHVFSCEIEPFEQARDPKRTSDCMLIASLITAPRRLGRHATPSIR